MAKPIEYNPNYNQQDELGRLGVSTKDMFLDILERRRMQAGAGRGLKGLPKVGGGKGRSPLGGSSMPPTGPKYSRMMRNAGVAGGVGTIDSVIPAGKFLPTEYRRRSNISGLDVNKLSQEDATELLRLFGQENPALQNVEDYSPEELRWVQTLYQRTLQK